MLTEHQVFDRLCHWHGGPISDQAQARALLRVQIKQEPVVLAEMPDSLLAKMEIKVDKVFDAKDLAVAQAVKAKCNRRIHV
jgi:hypothetical protein